MQGLPTMLKKALVFLLCLHHFNEWHAPFAFIPTFPFLLSLSSFFQIDIPSWKRVLRLWGGQERHTKRCWGPPFGYNQNTYLSLKMGNTERISITILSLEKFTMSFHGFFSTSYLSHYFQVAHDWVCDLPQISHSLMFSDYKHLNGGFLEGEFWWLVEQSTNVQLIFQRSRSFGFYMIFKSIEELGRWMVQI